MATSKQDLQSPKMGMNRDSHDSQLENTEYSFAMNANFQDEHGNGEAIIQNEESNILCSVIKPGYKVLGHKFDLNLSRTYLWIVNPETKASEIGYINIKPNQTSLEEIENDCKCNASAILETPLEKIDQLGYCTYQTLVADSECESGKMNFDINFPIFEKNIQIKNERLGIYIYWTDNLNPPRYLHLDSDGITLNYKYFNKYNSTTCQIEPNNPVCLDVDAMRIFRLFNKPCIVVEDITEGGNLKAGSYEVMIAYSNMSGDPISNYYSLTNPITIFDKNNYQMDQTGLDYISSQAIKVSFKELDTEYEFFTVALIYRSGLDQSTSIYNYGIYSTDTSSLVINTIQNKTLLGGDDVTFKQSLEVLLNVKPSILTTKGMTNSNGYLFQYGYKEQRELNLQPVVNFMGAFAKWATVQSKEDLYEYGDNVSNFTGYMRDEVYPFGIKFFLDGGYETALFPFIPAPAIGTEMDFYESGSNYDSIAEYNPDCSPNERNKKWQYINTASKGTPCTDTGIGMETKVVNRIVEDSCVPTDEQNQPIVFETIDTGELEYTSDLDLLEYINSNKVEFSKLTSGTPTELAIRDVFIKEITLVGTNGTAKLKIGSYEYLATYNGNLTTTASDFVTAYAASMLTNNKVILTSSAGKLIFKPDNSITALPIIKVKNESGDLNLNTYDCIPIFGGEEIENENLVQTEDEYFLISVVEGGVIETPALPENYKRVTKPAVCSQFVEDADNPGVYLLEDRRYYGPNTYKRKENSNLDHTKAKDLPNLQDPQTDAPRYLTRPPIVERSVPYGTHISAANETNFNATNIPELWAKKPGTTLNYPSISSGSDFANVIHKGAIWFKVTMDSGDVKEVEISPSNITGLSDYQNGTKIRVTILKEDPDNAGEFLLKTAYIIDDITTFDESKNFFELVADEFNNFTAYIVIDGPIRPTGYHLELRGITASHLDNYWWSIMTRSFQNISVPVGMCSGIYFCGTAFEDNDDSARGWVNWAGPQLDLYHNIYAESSNEVVYMFLPNTYFVPQEYEAQAANDDVYTEYPRYFYYTIDVPKGCFNIFKRDRLVTRTQSFTDMKFGRSQSYEQKRRFRIPVLNNCKAVPYESGKFAYWESTETYPCNSELFDSSSLIVEDIDIPDAYQDDFLEYYADSKTVDGVYLLNDNADFTNKKIRHYKFPDNTISPFMNEEAQAPGDFKKGIIYPIGFSISPAIIRGFLDVAVKNNLITAEEKNKITKYEIYRGDRRTEKSVIAKGILFDMLSEEDGGNKLYSNYPLNSQGKDAYNNTTQSSQHNNFSFISPTTSFFKPTLPKEMKIEGYMYGKSKSIFDTVDGHPTYTILGREAYSFATALAAAECTLELTAKSYDWTVNAATGGLSAAVAAGIAFTGIAFYTVEILFKYGQIRMQWIETLYKLGQPKNHAYFQTALGHYNYFIPNVEDDQGVRGLAISHYLREGMWNIADENTGNYYKVNNYNREDSVFLSVSSDYPYIYPAKYVAYDNTITNASKSSRTAYSGSGRSPDIIGNAASPYAALKRYLPAQYGGIGAINWISTGFCGNTNLSESCNPIFGGDTYISRFSVKRKFPFFTTNAYGLAPMTPYTYSLYFNINPEDRNDLSNIGSKRFYINYKTVDEQAYTVDLFSTVFPDSKSQYKLDNVSSNGMYLNDEAKFYLFSYGFPYFLVESEINCNYRYSGYEDRDQFYPRIGDISRYTQEKVVSIKEQEDFRYNSVYSMTALKTNWRLLPFTYNREQQDKLAIGTNSLIVSKQDRDEVSLTDPWLYYDALDMHEFPRKFGELVSITSIESNALLVRFTNGMTLLEADKNVMDQLAANEASFNITDLGYAGTQHQTIASTEYGHFTVDAKRGKVFRVKPSGQGIDEITKGMEKWFKEQLPFKILSQYPQANVDNAYKGLGLIIGWDDRLKRLFITKKDFLVKTDKLLAVKWEDEIGFHTAVGEVKTPLDYTNVEFFEDCSWTVAYSPLTNTWISYYSFKPNYFVSYSDFFQTGVNYSNDTSEIGVWSHMSFLSSYQVFYGRLYPFTVEYAIPTKYANSVLQTVTYLLDVKKYYNKYDSADVYGKGFNKAIIYNSQQNSGLLNLVHQRENDLSQMVLYPRHNATSIDILQSEMDGRWSFNYFYNLIKNERNGLPVFKYDKTNIDKQLNNKLLDFRSNHKDRLRGDYFKVILTQDLESRLKYLLRIAIDDRSYY
jgi:hypothetical protein